MDLSKDIYSTQPSFHAAGDLFSQQITYFDRNLHSTDSIHSNVSHTQRGIKAKAHPIGSIPASKRSKRRRQSYKLLNSRTSRAVTQCTCDRVRSESEPDKTRTANKRKKAPSSRLTIATNATVSSIERSLSYLRQSDTPTTDIEMEDLFEMISGDDDDGDDDDKAPFMVYGGSGSNKSSNEDKKSGDEHCNDANNDNGHHKKGGSKDHNNDNKDKNGSGSRSNDDHGDEDEDEDKNNENQIHDPHDKISVDKAHENIFFSVLQHMDHLNEDELKEQLLSIGGSLQHMIDTTCEKLTRIHAMRTKLPGVEALNVQNSLGDDIGTDSVEAIKVKSTSKRRKGPKQKEKNPYIPSEIQSTYKISRDLTNVQIPKRVAEVENVESIYQFVLKLLAINKDNYLQYEKWRIFNCDLQEKYTNENIYFIAVQSMDPNIWILDQIMSESEITSAQHMIQIPSNHLPSPSPKFNKAIQQMSKVKGIIMKYWTQIVEKTKWHKIDVYKAKNNIRRMTLFWDKPAFMKQLKKIMNNPQIIKNIEPIPIILFGANDECCVQYVFTVPLEENVDIGIAFECYPSRVNDVPKVVGIHVDKQLLVEQHQIVSPNARHIKTCTKFKGFGSQINDLYIGNPDDYLNQKKNLQNQLHQEKKKNRELQAQLLLKDQLSESVPPFPLKLSISSSTNRSICSNAPPLVLEETRSKSLSTISERRDSLSRTYLSQSRSASPSVTAHKTALSPLIIPMTKFGSLPEDNLEKAQSFPDPPNFPNNDQ